MKLYCCFCLHIQDAEPKSAITIIDGLATCHDHETVASGKGDFLDKLATLLE